MIRAHNDRRFHDAIKSLDDNDLILLKKELEGYAARPEADAAVPAMIVEIDRILAAESSGQRRSDAGKEGS
ncbi:MAG: hypothetical protein M5R36_21070 [Deltaproteobacteria bacterium]|nr:hypothetical protein [Deltaproteobacteria bacterium]